MALLGVPEDNVIQCEDALKMFATTRAAVTITGANTQVVAGAYMVTSVSCISLDGAAVDGAYVKNNTGGTNYFFRALLPILGAAGSSITETYDPPIYCPDGVYADKAGVAGIDAQVNVTGFVPTVTSTG